MTGYVVSNLIVSAIIPGSIAAVILVRCWRERRQGR